MRTRLKWIIPSALIVAAAAVYLWPTPRVPFGQLYAKVGQPVRAALAAFRQAHPPRQIMVEGLTWEYMSAGRGAETLVLLHGMTGAYDIWWQLIDRLEPDYRIIAVTYPAAQSLEAMETGLLAILRQEQVGSFHVVGTSLGGYFAQYLVARHPDRIGRAVFANTFPPNDLIAEKNGALGALLPFLPEWVVMSVLRGSFQNSIYPTSGGDELTLAFLNEVGSGRMSKAQVVGRFRCVVEKFTAPAPTIPVLIIESDNDPLVEPALREQLKATYPAAAVQTFIGAGHFPYLNQPDEYSRVLAEFLGQP